MLRIGRSRKGAAGWRGSPPQHEEVGKVLVFESELERISSWAVAYPDVETGGSLFGYWTHSGAGIIQFAVGPGRRARHEGMAFYQDEDYLTGCSRILYASFGLQHIGEWHSHHQMRLYRPSSGDERTVLRGMKARSWPSFIMGLTNLEVSDGTVHLGFFQFDLMEQCYRECELQRLPGESPIRASRPSLPAGEPELEARRPSRWQAREMPLQAAPVRQGWYGQAEVRKRLAKELRGLSLLEAYGYSHDIEPRGDELRLRIGFPDGRQSDWLLQQGFPLQPPVVLREGRRMELAWNSDRLIAEHLVEERVEAGPIVHAPCSYSTPAADPRSEVSLKPGTEELS